ncbi:MAG: hypothetical protein Q7V05_08345 [Methanoregula sp.]|nr:hypothetical protein [Methanoregula sp.]
MLNAGLHKAARFVPGIPDGTCGLSDCHPTGKLTAAFDALAAALRKEYGDRVDLKLTLVYHGVPDYVKTVIETDFPPLPIVMVNGKLTRIGRIALDRIKKETDAVCCSSGYPCKGAIPEIVIEPVNLHSLLINCFF